MLVVTNFKRKIMKAYIRENTLSDNRHQSPSITYDVIVKGDLNFLYDVLENHPSYDNKQFNGISKNGELEYNPANKTEALQLLESIKHIAIKLINSWN
jgi:hypothetical protein